MFTGRPTRRPGHDYTAAGWYFVTVVVAGRRRRLGQLTAEGVRVSRIGDHCIGAWDATLASRPWISADAFCIMPDHVHFLVGWDQVPSTCQGSLSDFVAQFKAMTTRASRFQHHLGAWELLWAPGYYDRVIRNNRHRENVRRYIEADPARAWQDNQSMRSS